MPTEIKMPALSPTMEEGKLAKWLVKVGDEVVSGDILAEIETDKATMEFEAVDEGVIAAIAVAEGSDAVKVGTVIAMLADDGEDPDEISAPDADAASPKKAPAKQADDKANKPAVKNAATTAKDKAASGKVAADKKAKDNRDEPAPATQVPAAPETGDGRIIASPLARRIAAERGVDIASVSGSGPHGRIIKADVESAEPGTAKPEADSSKPASPAPGSSPAPAPAEKPAIAEMAKETRALLDDRVPHTVETLSGMRKTIARRLSQSMQEAPHIYLTVDVRLDRLMDMRKELNQALQPQGIKLSVNDLLIKALGRALIDVPECNVTFAGNELIRYERADISMAVSIPGGLITPIVADASGKSLSAIAKTTKDLIARAQGGKLSPQEYQGGTASISNMGMMGIKHFTAVINPPQSTILAIGAGEKRAWVMPGDQLGVATVMSATGSFDHRAVDGADGARLMSAFRQYVESPLGMVA